MDCSGFCIFEYDDNDETFITFVYPSLTANEKNVIQEIAHHLITSSNTFSIVSSYENRFFYFDAKRNTERTDSVRLYGVCVFGNTFNPKLFCTLSKILSEKMLVSKQAPPVLRDFLKAVAEGELSFKGIVASANKTEEIKFDSLLDRAGQNIPIIWTALVTGKSIAIYSPDLQILQTTFDPILSLCKPGKRGILPFVMESSHLQKTNAAKYPSYIIFSSDQAVLNAKLDLIVDLASRTVKIGNESLKENSLGVALMGTVNQATTSDEDVIEAIVAFNEQILDILGQIKERYGEVTVENVQALNLASDKKSVLTGFLTGGVFNI